MSIFVQILLWSLGIIVALFVLLAVLCFITARYLDSAFKDMFLNLDDEPLF